MVQQRVKSVLSNGSISCFQTRPMRVEIMRDEDAADAASVTEKCSPEREERREEERRGEGRREEERRGEERVQDVSKCRQRANYPRNKTDDGTKAKRQQETLCCLQSVFFHSAAAGYVCFSIRP